MNSRTFRCSLVALMLGLIPSRYFDRMQTQPQAPSRWETAIHNAQQGRVSAGRRMQKDKPGSHP